ncbi:hypothetical protein MYCTH_2295966 [Thermothelomyces thermophilus ATCC 42464]|uniref:Uncharacterized protein n=1 Tax=Thermothelomyces thermophilus (strain ATCC 42464 / BCRC 31852 / DSM 1799) TaxID=573729 RepID=G2PZV5_THET4|nr:uncharacterized protein MYCTH_2295966 [Thermothelomyces thermophilus ATCC 42464]AEO53978.1 hypothetical protein MYCTH_2295966 [Thermothelomyces thermophilus ATCC 42464]
MGSVQLLQTLTESFIALSDEVQSLIDRKTILEHKLRYAHEQYQCLADKYAPAVPEVAEILAQIQLPPDLNPHPAAATAAVPLPRRGQAGNNQHQIALLIREGRKAAQELVAGIVGANASREGSTSLGMEGLASVSTVLEKDFTVEGKKGALACPFSAKPDQNGGLRSGAQRVDGSQDPAGAADPTPHKSSDPICAAMLEDSTKPSLSAPSKCPIRFLDKHSPEEIARYVETHKHAIPRSHEVCVRRYQRNEEQVKKLDAKYGNLVNMVKDLSQLHRPLMPPSQDDLKEADRASNKRVEDWAQTVVAGNPEPEDGPEPPVDEEREARFDRPLRDVRVGESPSRPWGISVPLEAGLRQREPSPKPVEDVAQADKEASGPPKCPFDHTKMFTGAARREDTAEQPSPTTKPDAPPPSTPQPTFVNLPEAPAANRDRADRPQVVFNISGPVFIGYPMEQAIEFMKQFQGR